MFPWLNLNEKTHVFSCRICFSSLLNYDTLRHRSHQHYLHQRNNSPFTSPTAYSESCHLCSNSHSIFSERELEATLLADLQAFSLFDSGRDFWICVFHLRNYFSLASFRVGRYLLLSDFIDYVGSGRDERNSKSLLPRIPSSLHHLDLIFSDHAA